MKILISPSKTQNDIVENKNNFLLKATKPIFESEALLINQYLIDQQKNSNYWKQLEIKTNNNKLIEHSINLLNNFNNNKECAILKYNGLQFKNIDFLSLNEIQQNNLDKNLYIISAYYGLLKPSNIISSYRLMMNSNFNIDNKNNLVNFWSTKINKELSNQDFIIDLASQEYGQVINDLQKPIYRIYFCEEKENKLQSKATLAKICRGKMVNLLSNYEKITLDILKSLNIYDFVYQKKYDSNSNNIHSLYFVKK